MEPVIGRKKTSNDFDEMLRQATQRLKKPHWQDHSRYDSCLLKLCDIVIYFASITAVTTILGGLTRWQLVNGFIRVTFLLPDGMVWEWSWIATYFSNSKLFLDCLVVKGKHMNSMKTCPFVTFYFMKISFSDIDRKWILPNMIRAVPALIIFCKIHFLLISEKEIFMK